MFCPGEVLSKASRMFGEDENSKETFERQKLMLE